MTRPTMLLGQFDSPFVRRVGIALETYGLPYEHRPWSVWGDADELARYTPLLRVPVVVLEDGVSLVESSAILDTLDELAGDAVRLVPATGAMRREVLRVCALSTGLADKAVSYLYERVLRPEPTRSSVWTARCERQVRATLDLLEEERTRSATTWWFGEKMTHADIAVACVLRFLREAHGATFRIADWKQLDEHARRCEALPVFQKIAQPLHVSV